MVKRSIITVVVVALLVFATSAVALAENGVIWPKATTLTITK